MSGTTQQSEQLQAGHEATHYQLSIYHEWWHLIFHLLWENQTEGQGQ